MFFTRLEKQFDLYSNPGKFYQAITYLKRGEKDDRKHAQRLLEQVVQEDLEGSRTAAGWLKHF